MPEILPVKRDQRSHNMFFPYHFLSEVTQYVLPLSLPIKGHTICSSLITSYQRSHNMFFPYHFLSEVTKLLTYSILKFSLRITYDSKCFPNFFLACFLVHCFKRGIYWMFDQRSHKWIYHKRVTYQQVMNDKTHIKTSPIWWPYYHMIITRKQVLIIM